MSHVHTSDARRESLAGLAARERRLRRAAERLGLRLENSRSRRVGDMTVGTYHLVDASTNYVVCGVHPYGYGCDLDEIARELSARRVLDERGVGNADVEGVA